MSLREHTKIIFAAGRQIMEAKNTDYAGGSQDPFSNFRSSKVLGVEPEIGLMMRTMDKSKRIQSFLANGKMAVASEPVDDAIADKLNYYVLLSGLLAERFPGFFFRCPNRASLLRLHSALEDAVLSATTDADYDAALLEATVDGMHPLLAKLRDIRQGFSWISKLLREPWTQNLDNDSVMSADGYVERTLDPLAEHIVNGLRAVALMHYHVTKQRADAAAEAAAEAQKISKLTEFAASEPLVIERPAAAAPPVPPPAPAPPVGL